MELGEPVLGAVIPATIIASEGKVDILAALVTLYHESSFSVLGIVADTRI
jgi:hypothetical protein